MIVSSKPALLVFLLLLLLFFLASSAVRNTTNGGIPLRGIELPQHPSFNSMTPSIPDCGLSSTPTSPPPPLKLQLNHITTHQTPNKDSLTHSTHRDLLRIHNHHHRRRRRLAAADPPSQPPELVATLESGLSLGSGEYFMDVYVGTPPKHFSLILDTGSDLNWLQCLPCHDCFAQSGPLYDPLNSSSFRNLTCRDQRCALVSPPDAAEPCSSDDQPCPYFYWYGDRSNTTGDFATETLTVNLTGPGGGDGSAARVVEGFMFGCGHWNRGLFRGAAGLLGLGRGPLSFASQMHALHGHGAAFSYCLVDRFAGPGVSSRLVFGEDPDLLAHPNLNYTALVKHPVDDIDNTFYYVDVKAFVVGGEALDVPAAAFTAGGTIVDSGTTLSYFAEPVYGAIRAAFKRGVRNYEAVDGFLIGAPCFNVSSGAAGLGELGLPGFEIVFRDGAVWAFPVENYFIRMEPQNDVVCLAMLGTPKDSLSIIGNYQQQNFHVMYDVKRSRLGYAPHELRRCVKHETGFGQLNWTSL